MVKRSILAGTFACSLFAGCATAASSVPPFKADLSEFVVVTTPAATRADVMAVRPDGVIAVAGKPSGYFESPASYSNYRLHAEWRWSDKPGNAGVLLHIASGPKDRVWPLSQQVQTKIGSAGDLLPMAGASFAEPLTSAPGASPQIKAKVAADSEKPAGEWNSMDVICRDGTIEVTINGVAQNRITQASPREGKIGFQLEGAPYELRNVRVTALD